LSPTDAQSTQQEALVLVDITVTVVIGPVAHLSTHPLCGITDCRFAINTAGNLVTADPNATFHGAQRLVGFSIAVIVLAVTDLAPRCARLAVAENPAEPTHGLAGPCTIPCPQLAGLGQIRGCLVEGTVTIIV